MTTSSVRIIVESVRFHMEDLIRSELTFVIILLLITINFSGVPRRAEEAIRPGRHSERGGKKGKKKKG